MHEARGALVLRTQTTQLERMYRRGGVARIGTSEPRAAIDSARAANAATSRGRAGER